MSSGMNRTGLRLMSRLGAVLGVNDVKSAPARLKTDELVPVISVDPGWADYRQVQLIGQTAVAGTAVWTWMGIGADISSSSAGVPANSVYPSNAGEEIAILGMSVEVAYSGVGLPAGNILRLREMRRAASSAASVITASRFHHFGVVRQDTQYFWSYPMWGYGEWVGNDPESLSVPPVLMAASPIWVPAGSWYGLEVHHLNATGDVLAAWPANTFINLNIMFATCPKGFRPPGL
jgi:hypothetical protein